MSLVFIGTPPAACNPVLMQAFQSTRRRLLHAAQDAGIGFLRSMNRAVLRIMVALSGQIFGSTRARLGHRIVKGEGWIWPRCCSDFGLLPSALGPLPFRSASCHECEGSNIDRSPYDNPDYGEPQKRTPDLNHTSPLKGSWRPKQTTRDVLTVSSRAKYLPQVRTKMFASNRGSLLLMCLA